jgi:hypothetical protein
VEQASSPATLEGPAFTLGVKLLATALVASVAALGWRARSELMDGRASLTSLLFLALVSVFVAIGYVAILRSRTRIDATHIEQTWIVDKRVAIADITQVKFVYIPGAHLARDAATHRQGELPGIDGVPRGRRPRAACVRAAGDRRAAGRMSAPNEMKEAPRGASRGS